MTWAINGGVQLENLFQMQMHKKSPLADRMRPSTLDEFIGQEHIVGKGKLLRRAIETDSLTSSIFFGPPGCGKTTLASIIANETKSGFVKINAVSTGVKDMRQIIEKARTNLELYGKATYVILDECHRWTRAQSDTILPAIESGVIRFIGSTTENPMISMTAAIVSRCRVFQFHPLSKEDIIVAIDRALNDKENGYGDKNIKIDKEAKDHLALVANGDVRSALNALELAVESTKKNEENLTHITKEIAEESIQKRIINVDDEHFYNMLSAFCKSLRGSDSDAALAWFARMIYAGVDPRIIARRIIAHASEDVGLANSGAMVQAVAAAEALEKIGMPEARLSLAQAIIYICESPKSNSVVVAIDKAFSDVEKYIDEPVPVHLRDTSYKGANKLGNGVGYKYPHDYEGHFIKQQYMPDSIKDRKYYEPSEQGQEKNILKLRELRNNKK